MKGKIGFYEEKESIEKTLIFDLVYLQIETFCLSILLIKQKRSL